MSPLMTGPEFGLRELDRAIRWESCFQRLCLYDWLVQDGESSRRRYVESPAVFYATCIEFLGERP